MRLTLALLALVALMAGACAETSSSRPRSSVVDQARTCAACGASVGGDYFLGSSMRAVGPGSY
jgi:hypothetical protein